MLSDAEKAILEAAKQANPHWFNAMTDAAEIMVERRQKYAGKEHPYFNFVDLKRRMGPKFTMKDVFSFYLNIKGSRLSASDNDFDDERVVDTFMDAGNYAFIAAGWFLDGLTEEDVINEDV